MVERVLFCFGPCVVGGWNEKLIVGGGGRFEVPVALGRKLWKTIGK